MRILTIIFLLFLSFTSWAIKTPKVAFILPDPINTENEFWSNTTKQIIKAAEDLAVDLEVIYTESHHSYYIQTINEVAQRPPKMRPDYLMILPMKNSSEMILRTLEKANIKTFFVNSHIIEDDSSKIGSPRGKFKNWIGQFYPDDTQSARLVTEEVFKSCGKNSEVVSINGNHVSSASALREKSFSVTSDRLSLNLKQSFFANWQKERVQKMLPFITGRYPKLCGFLVSSDFMAEAIVESKNNKYKVCSIDWTSNGIKNVISKKQLCTVGGHFLEPAFALVALFDYHNGIDFKDDFGLIYESPFYVANKNNAQSIYNRFFLNKSTFNYRNLSKVYNKKIKKYDFNIFK